MLNPTSESSKIDLDPDSLGVITKSHGIRGGLRMYCPDVERARSALPIGSEVIVEKRDTSRVVSCVQEVIWENHLRGKHTVLLTLTGISDRTEADTFRNAKVYLPEGAKESPPKFPFTLLGRSVNFLDESGEPSEADFVDFYKTPAHWIGVARDKKERVFEFPLVTSLLFEKTDERLFYGGAVLESQL